jgi:hypothetical protein
VRFIFGIDAMPNLHEIVEKLPENAWKKLHRRAKYEVQTAPRRRPVNVKQQVVERREFEDIRLVNEYVAEFRYRPGKCRKTYRVVVVWKDLEVHQGQKKLFDDSRCFFYITNDEELPPVSAGTFSGGVTQSFSMPDSTNDWVPHLSTFQEVPEPATLTLLGIGLAAIALRWRRRNSVQVESRETC